jgi:phosphoribosylaminoimidazole-succinocarboxamide synthase
MNTFPDRIDLKLDKPCYIGSVQKLYDVPEYPDLLVSETTSGGSVFDVGTIFNIMGSDVGRAGFRHLVFLELQDPEAWAALSGLISGESHLMRKDESGLAEKILAEFCDKGAPTHHVGMVDRESGEVFSKVFPPKLSNLTLIKKYKVMKPALKNVCGWHFYDYEQYHHTDGNVIPLEYIVRLGITSGSSILRKYNAMGDTDRKAYLSELGIDQPLSPWIRFDTPLVDLTTKYEPEDRNISRQEAALISGVDGETFSRSMVMAVLGAFLLQQIFNRMGLSLWDLKWEIARHGDDLVFVDTIDTDSVRVTFNLVREGKSCFVHFNKQAMRDFYKIIHPEWLGAVNEAKKVASNSGKPFTEVLCEGQKKNQYPKNPVVDEAFLDVQKQKFSMIQSFIRNQGQELGEEAERIAGLEIAYYESVNKREEYLKLNSAGR